MKLKLVPNFILVILILIIGAALFKQVDFPNFRVEKPALSAVYTITIIICIGLMVKKSKKK